MEGGALHGPPEAMTPTSQRRTDAACSPDALRAELAAMSLRALTTRAVEMGVDEAKLDAADTKGAIVELVLEALVPAEAEAGLAAELADLSLRTATRHAEQMGVDEAWMDEADAAGDTQAGLVSPILELARAAPGDACAGPGVEDAPEDRVCAASDDIDCGLIHSGELRDEQEQAVYDALADLDAMGLDVSDTSDDDERIGALSEPEPELEPEPEPGPHMYDPTPFERETDFPVGIFSYASGADGRKGKQHMWAVANALRKRGITTFNGQMVASGDWDEEWFGKLDQAQFAIVMPCEAFWKSKQCPKELVKILKRLPERRIFLLRVDESFKGSLPTHNFLGDTEQQRTRARFFRTKLTMNCLPTPGSPLFQEHFEANCDELCNRIFAELPELRHPDSERAVANPPGSWDVMISYTQRNAVAEALASRLCAAFADCRLTVWLDVQMQCRDEAAMKEAVENSRCIVAIVTGDDPGDENAYFNRDFCLKEQRWAKHANKFVQPVVVAEDKHNISKMMRLVPRDLQHLKGVNWEHIDRTDIDYFNLGVTKIIKAAGLQPKTASLKSTGSVSSAGSLDSFKKGMQRIAECKAVLKMDIHAVGPEGSAEREKFKADFVQEIREALAYLLVQKLDQQGVETLNRVVTKAQNVA